MNKQLFQLSKIIRQEWFHELFRFGLVGVIATGIQYLVYWIFTAWLSPTFAYSIGFIISFICNFFLTSLFTFRKKATIKKGFGFALTHIISFSVQLLLLNLFIAMQIPEKLAPLPVYAIAIPFSFILVRFVFKSSKL